MEKSKNGIVKPQLLSQKCNFKEFLGKVCVREEEMMDKEKIAMLFFVDFSGIFADFQKILRHFWIFGTQIALYRCSKNKRERRSNRTVKQKGKKQMQPQKTTKKGGKTMKKKLTALTAMALAAMLAFTGCGGGGEDAASTDGEKYVLKVTTGLAETSPNAVALYEFEKDLEEKSGGRIDVQVYAGSSLVTSDEQGAEMVVGGATEMAVHPFFALGKVTNTPEYEIFDYPFMFKNRDVYNEFAKSDVIQELNERVEANNTVKVMGAYDISFLDIGNNKKPLVNVPEDGKGLKIRSAMGAIWVDGLEALGPSAVPIAFGEVFSALQQGTLDGVLTTGSNMISSRFYEVMDYVTLSHHILSCYAVMVNSNFYDSLPADLQQILQECIDTFTANAQAKYAEEDATLADTFRENGVEVYEFQEGDFEKWKEAAQPAIDKNVDATLGREFYDRCMETIAQIEADLGV